MISLTVMNDRAAESAEQEQTARMCSLFLLYTLRKINKRSHTAFAQGLVEKCANFFIPPPPQKKKKKLVF